MTCNQSVGWYLLDNNKIKEEIRSEYFEETNKIGKWVAEGTCINYRSEADVPALEKIPSDAVIAMKRSNFPNWSHIMVSVGGGKAKGSNNPCVFSPSAGGSPEWKELKLKDARYAPEKYPDGFLIKQSHLIICYRLVESFKHER